MREYSDTDVVILGAVLSEIAHELGFKETTKREIATVAKFIRNNYLDIRISEISDAFDLGISGKLNMDRSEVNHYNSFSKLYVSGFLNAYIFFKNSKLSDERAK